MTEQLYLDNAYIRECDATLLHVFILSKKWIAIILDRTCLQPSHRDGGDAGHLVMEDGDMIQIEKVVNDTHSGRIEHRTRFRGEIPVGKPVKCVVNWDRRYLLMRKHTGNHLLYGCGKLLLGRGFTALSKTTLGDTYTHWIGQAESVDEDTIGEIFRMANEVILEGRKVDVETLSRQEALEKCGKYHEAIIPQALRELRVVTIEELDSNPCIGLHVRNVQEIKNIRLDRVVREKGDLKIYSYVE